MNREFLYKGLRDWITEADKLGELKRLNGADWDLEIGALTEVSAREMENRYALLFDDIKGYPKGHRVLTNFLGSVKRLALTVGFPTDFNILQFVNSWRKFEEGLRPIDPREISTCEVFKNHRKGSKIDLLEFPVPRWHEHDGGRYIGTADCIITRDPDNGWINVGTYRVQVIDHDKVSVQMAPGRHGRIHYQKHFARGKSCPIAMVFGVDPLTFMVAASGAPFGTSEYAYAGGIRGEPIEVVQALHTNLPVPASAELVIEGEMVPGQEVLEGPFGEFTGHYAGGESMEPLVYVRAIMYRDEPIITGASPARPPGYDSVYWQPLLWSGMIWTQLEKVGVPDVRGVWIHHPGARFFIVVSIKQRYAGHAKQAALIASQCIGGAHMNKWVIVVDDDVDPTNINDVLWAMSVRCDPERDIDISRDTWSQRLDPMQHDNLSSKAIVNACKPYAQINSFPKTVEVSQKLRVQVLEKWSSVLESASFGEKHA
jgi:4-hydroxy-3-polyprenylbenzoate decarboxylase